VGQRERVGADGERVVPTARPHGATREREGVNTLGLAPTGEACLSGTEGARAQARLSGLVWAELAFSFFL
jgi:hypothetical protein